MAAAFIQARTRLMVGRTRKEDRARSFLVCLGLPDGEAACPIRFNLQIVYFEGDGLGNPQQAIGHKGDQGGVAQAPRGPGPRWRRGRRRCRLATTASPAPDPGLCLLPWRRIPASTRPDSGPTGEGCPVAFARKRTAAHASVAEGGRGPGLMQGGEVFGQLRIMQGGEVLALLLQVSLYPVERRLIGPACVLGKAGPGQLGGGGRESGNRLGTSGPFFDCGGGFSEPACRGAAKRTPIWASWRGLMALCSLPRTNPGNRKEYVRRNGPYKLGMTAGLNNKLPYGNIPRLLLAWVCTEAVRMRKRELVLGRSLYEFMRKLGMEDRRREHSGPTGPG